MYDLFFFFSSRRRHTRLQGDWSSDVCSSDLTRRAPWRRAPAPRRTPPPRPWSRSPSCSPRRSSRDAGCRTGRRSSCFRSEERRVGKGVDLGGRRIIKKKKKKYGGSSTLNKHR